MELVHNRHSVGGSNYHMQFTPKYRVQVFRVESIRKLIEALIRRKAYQLGIHIEAIEFGPDHVHIFATDCRKYSVSYIVNQLKGYSSWYIRRALPEYVQAYLWGDSLWSDGYFYESIGRVTANTVKFYIERQQGKHWIHAEQHKLPCEHISPGQKTLDAFYPDPTSPPAPFKGW